jgi:hypothetical protein
MLCWRLLGSNMQIECCGCNTYMHMLAAVADTPSNKPHLSTAGRPACYQSDVAASASEYSRFNRAQKLLWEHVHAAEQTCVAGQSA